MHLGCFQKQKNAPPRLLSFATNAHSQNGHNVRPFGAAPHQDQACHSVELNPRHSRKNKSLCIIFTPQQPMLNRNVPGSKQACNAFRQPTNPYVHWIRPVNLTVINKLVVISTLPNPAQQIVRCSHTNPTPLHTHPLSEILLSAV